MSNIREESEKIILGKINGFHGVRGFVKIFSETRPRERILKYSRFFLKGPKGWLELELESGKQHSKHVLMQFKGYNDRDSVEPFLGCELAILREDLPELEEGVYWLDLMGLTVINLEGQTLGKIEDIFETGANDVLVVKGEHGEILIPYSVEYIVDEINLTEGFMRVDWELE